MGSCKITKNLINLDLIEIIQFCLKIYGFGNTLTCGLVYGWMMLSRDNTKHGVGYNTWVFILGRYKWHIHAGSWSLVNCWREGKTLPYIGCS